VYEDLDGTSRPRPSGDGAAMPYSMGDGHRAATPMGDGHRPAPPSGDGVAPPAWSSPYAPPSAPRPAAPAIQVGDPYAEPRVVPPVPETPSAPSIAPTLGYDPDEGIRIDFDPNPTTALAPIPRALPVERATPSALPAMPPPPVVPPPAAPVAAAPRAEARRSLKDKIRMLQRHKGLILACVAVGLALGAAHAFLTPPSYKAHSLLLITQSAGGAGGVAQAPGAGGSPVLNQALVLQQAPDIALRTARQLLDRHGAESLTVVAGAAEAYGAPVTVESLAAYLQEDVVTVEPAAEKADAIKVEATAGQPDEAALVAQLYTDEYQSITASSSRDRSARTREILDEQIVRRQGELDEIEQQLASFMTSENAAGLDAQTTETVSQIGQLQAGLDLANVEAQTQRARLAQLRSDLASVPDRLERSAAVPTQAETADLDAEIARLERLLEQIYDQNPELRGDPNGHPDVARMDSRLRDLRADRRRRIGAQTDAAVASGGISLSAEGAGGESYVASLNRQISQAEADLAGAEARARTLSGRLAEARSDLRAVPGQQVELGQLQRQQATVAATLQQLQTEADRAGLAETTELGFAQTIRDVQVPREPASPNPPMDLALGGLLGLLLGLGIAFIRYQTDSRARTPDDLRDNGFTVVGTIPDVTDALRGGRQEVEGASIHPALVTLTRSFAPEAEAFRHLHAGLYAGGGAHPQVVLVGSPDVHVGKSLVAGNLAVAAAQAGRRVLLVDADLRHPSVAALLGLGGQAPLGQGPEESNMVYWSTAVPGLFAMTPREMAQAPEQMWAPHVIGALLQNLRQAFDLVVVDTPAALSSADATLLAPHADAALLVAEADQTDIDAMTQVATELAGVGLTRVGSVLNRFDASSTVGYKTTVGARHTPRERD